MRRLSTLLALLLAIFAMAPSAFAQNVHSVWGEKPLYLKDGETGTWYDNVKGTATINWKDGTRYGFQQATLNPITITPSTPLTYEFILVAISSCNDDYIEGLWDIRRNGVLVVNGGVGRAYGINAPVGQYFKVYVGDSKCYSEKWHFSAYVTNRLDY